MNTGNTKLITDAFKLDIIVYSNDNSTRLGRPTVILGFDPASRDIKWFKLKLDKEVESSAGARTSPRIHDLAKIERAANWIGARLHYSKLSRLNKNGSVPGRITLAQMEQWLSSEITKYRDDI